MTDRDDSGPGAVTPQGRPADRVAAAKQQRSFAVILRQGRRRRRYPLASASLYEPSCERTWWWISCRCPWCGSVHLHRVRREEDAEGVRRTGCGRKVFVKVRRVYRGNTSSGRAA
jgi:hypothetical protein